MRNEWLEAAKQAQQGAYVPYSKFAVGAALITDEEDIYTGCNIENASYGLSNCAERTAFFKAVSEGKSHFKHLVIIGDTDEPISPCGACRQVMVEFCQPSMAVTLCNTKGDKKETTVGELLPYHFDESHM